MLLPGSYPIKLYKGSTFGPIVLTCYDENDDPFDFTGYNAVYAEVRRGGERAVILDLEPTFSDPSGGEITIPGFTDEETADFVLGEYVWDLLVEDGAGAISPPLLSDRFDIVVKVTKST
jgi:hypothetical protein